MESNQQSEWEEEFDKRFPPDYLEYGQDIIDIKSFIHALLQKQAEEERQRILKLIDSMYQVGKVIRHDVASFDLLSYNFALEQLKKEIKE